MMAELIKSTLCEPDRDPDPQTVGEVMRSERANTHQGPGSNRSHRKAEYMGAIRSAHQLRKSLLPGTGPYMGVP